MSNGAGSKPNATAAYNAVRAHELMLNEAAAELERAVVPPLLTLNGGAAAAFLTLLGALGPDADLRAHLWLASGAVVAWVAGLVAAAWAFAAAKSQQSALNKGHRLMRELLESNVFGPEVASIIAVEERQTDAHRRSDRHAAATSFKYWKSSFDFEWKVSVVCFVLGCAFALAAIIAGTV